MRHFGSSRGQPQPFNWAKGTRLLIPFTSAVGAQLFIFWILVSPLWDMRSLQGFRDYFVNDQLSYASISTTVAAGNFRAVEPLTETGVSFYPSAWYYVIGIVSWVTGAPVYAVWQIVGLVAVGAGIAVLGFLGYRLSGNRVAPLLPGLALATGTFSIVSVDYWYTSLGYHAVIWGPFGTLFTLNAESIGVMTVAVVFTWAVVSALQAVRRGSRFPPVVLVAVAVVLGLLANVQTYSFFTGTSLIVAFGACVGLFLRPGRWRLLGVLVGLALVLVFGGLVAEVVGPLPLFGLLLLAMLPAYWPLIREQLLVAVATVAAFGLAASPQVVRTAFGLVSGDDFLNYRQASTEDLGIDFGPALLGALPLIALMVTLLVAALIRPRTPESKVVTAMVVALAGGALVMSTNDLWGFEQEPYRFWLQYSIVGLLSLATVLPWAWKRRAEVQRSAARTVVVLSVVAGVVWAASLCDVLAFRDYARSQGVIAAEDSFGQALREVVGGDSGMVLSSACLDPQLLRLITGAPVAYFNRGLAWPEKREEIDQLLDPGRVAASDPGQVAAAGVAFVLTDSACENEWSYQDARVQPERIQPYPGGTLTLWRVAPPPL